LTAPTKAELAASLAVLQATLSAEQAASFGYGVLGAHLTGTAQQTARTDWVAHEVAVDYLTALIRRAGAQPHPAAVGYQLPFAVQSPASARELAVFLEDKVTQAYMGLVALAYDSLRELGARQVRATALRAAAWRGATVAFPGLPATSLRH
jgi:Domain of unknown function (DUF4439)